MCLILARGGIYTLLWNSMILAGFLFRIPCNDMAAEGVRFSNGGYKEPEILVNAETKIEPTELGYVVKKKDWH